MPHAASRPNDHCCSAETPARRRRRIDDVLLEPARQRAIECGTVLRPTDALEKGIDLAGFIARFVALHRLGNGGPGRHHAWHGHEGGLEDRQRLNALGASSASCNATLPLEE